MARHMDHPRTFWLSGNNIFAKLPPFLYSISNHAILCTFTSGGMLSRQSLLKAYIGGTVYMKREDLQELLQNLYHYEISNTFDQLQSFSFL